MKRVWILVVALMVLVALPSFSTEGDHGGVELDYSGDFRSFANYDFEADAGNAAVSRNRFQWKVAVDDYNSVLLRLHDANGNFLPADLGIHEFYLDTDFGAALGLPVALSGRFGFFEHYLTGWPRYTTVNRTNNAWVGDGIAEAFLIKLGFGPATLHYFNRTQSTDFMAGVNAAFAGVNAWLGYKSTYADLGGGDLAVEAAYALDFGDFTGNVSAAFKYGLGSEAWVYDFNLGAHYGMFHLGAGISGTDVEALDRLVAELRVSPMEAARIHAALYLLNGLGDLSVDIGATYNVGAAKFSLGYIIGEAIRVLPDNASYNAAGLYAGVTIAY